MEGIHGVLEADLEQVEGTHGALEADPEQVEGALEAGAGHVASCAMGALFRLCAVSAEAKAAVAAIDGEGLGVLGRALGSDDEAVVCAASKWAFSLTHLQYLFGPTRIPGRYR